MRVYSRRLPVAQRFLCTRRSITELFDPDLAWVSFGEIGASFRLDPRSSPRPKLTGRVVASLTVSPYPKEAYLCLYPVPRTEITESAAEEFSASLLPRLRDWLTATLARPETEVRGHEAIIAELVHGEYHLHQVQYRYGGT